MSNYNDVQDCRETVPRDSATPRPRPVQKSPMKILLINKEKSAPIRYISSTDEDLQNASEIFCWTEEQLKNAALANSLHDFIWEVAIGERVKVNVEE